MERLKVGVIGVGFIGKQHIEAIRRIPGTDIIAVSDVGPYAEKVSKSLGIAKYYTDYKEMLEQEELDVIHNCTPNGMHKEINEAAIQKGIHVYSEKPLTLTSIEAEELCNKCNSSQVKTAVNFNYRHHILVHEMKERVALGELGEFTHLQVEYLQDWLLLDTDYDWRMDKQMGGDSRAIADIGSHCFDLIQYITGQKIVSVNCHLFTMYANRKKGNKQDTFSSTDSLQEFEEVTVDTEDAAHILFRLENGIIGSIELSQICAGKKNGLKILISGNKQSVEWEQENPDKLFIGYRDKGNETIYASSQYLTDYAKKFAVLPNGHPVGWADAFTLGVKNFYEDIRAEKEDYLKVYADFSCGYYITKIVEACLLSNKSNKWIDIN